MHKTNTSDAQVVRNASAFLIIVAKVYSKVSTGGHKKERIHQRLASESFLSPINYLYKM